MNEALNVPTMAEMMAQGKTPEVLFWVGCAGSFDNRAKKVIRAFASLLIKAKVDFAVLGTEESCTGDPAKRSGNEFLFQMQAMTNIEVLNAYGVKKIVTTCPHCFNTLKNEYPSLGGNYQVLHHTQFLQSLLQEGRLRVSGGEFKGKKITFHDPCYLGRANDQYEAPRELLKELEAEVVEMKSCKSRGLCCGAGGAQMFKEPEKGNQDINVLRTQQAIDTQAKIIAVGCPFCNTMLTDGVKNKEQEKQIKVLDLAELLNNSII
ncbi:(Fe-S)-binding protein [Capnocytophaga canimorsus]|uniref:CoB--CoM heterodisulfide reductase n=1 Tax=Capnocytophaga canimorsus TaxID=28188 RepID=A0AAD0E888_9FLAO|nr:(Fe-S)-binding protein [Capnocytophaga canimorsus]ATA93545.1 CoB--CoM heterodisulfide reductase [Capnocytophaga canimorsus]AWL78300.1 (Fe-S)-binding protein [Capnocytophaga canimorsus]AYW36926.1 (Fe-S)-binding protein [Capnocytophaga canimorsus]MDT9499638.1 (Fe-S)-binding protein [Capnocytophaga canimorsus]